MKVLYAVYDRVAQAIVGGLMAFSHDAPVVRIFVDGLNDPATTLNKHPQDFELIAVGELLDEGPQPEISGYDKPRVVLTGEAYIASQATKPEVVK